MKWTPEFCDKGWVGRVFPKEGMYEGKHRCMRNSMHLVLPECWQISDTKRNVGFSCTIFEKMFL
jgi:hypothetical protein